LHSLRKLYLKLWANSWGFGSIILDFWFVGIVFTAYGARIEAVAN